MKMFIIGVVVTLAILYPAVTKHYFGVAVDAANVTTKSVIANAK